MKLSDIQINIRTSFPHGFGLDVQVCDLSEAGVCLLASKYMNCISINHVLCVHSRVHPHDYPMDVYPGVKVSKRYH